MKILFINTYDNPADAGGAEITIWTLMRSLSESGNQCVLLSTSDGNELTHIERDGIKIWRAGLKNLYWPTKDRIASTAARLAWHTVDAYSPLMQGYLKKVLKHEQPDIVSVHNLAGWSARTWNTLKVYNQPFVQVLHDQYAICPRSSMFRNNKNCASQCTPCRLLRLPFRGWSNRPAAVIGVSQHVLQRHEAQGYFRNVPIKQVIHNTRNAALLELNTPSKPRAKLRFGFIGRVDPSKGVEMLLDAFSEYDCDDVELWIAGTGDSGYVSHLKTRNVDGRISFLGRVQQKDFFPEIDVVIVPSVWHEPLGMVVAEALAFGKPVIGSRRGGIPEIIRHGENGLLFNPDNPNELTLHLALLAQDGELRRSMGQAARASSSPFLDTNAWSSAYLNIYNHILGRSSVTPDEK